MELEKALNQRRSIRTYTGETITEEQLKKILTAAYEAPIGMGRYDGIHLTIITNQKLLKEMDKTAAEFFGDPDRHPLYGAPLLIVISSATQTNVASANAGFILQNMSLEAVELGIGQCVIYGAIAAVGQSKDLLNKLQLPDGYTPLGGLALGLTDETYTDRQIPESHRYSVNRIE